MRRDDVVRMTHRMIVRTWEGCHHWTNSEREVCQGGDTGVAGPTSEVVVSRGEHDTGQGARGRVKKSTGRHELSVVSGTWTSCLR